MAFDAIAAHRLNAVIDHERAHLTHPLGLDVLKLPVDQRIIGFPSAADPEIGHELVHHVALERLLVHALHNGIADRLLDGGGRVARLVVGRVIERQDHGAERALIPHVLVHHGVEEFEGIDAAFPVVHVRTQILIQHPAPLVQLFRRELRERIGRGLDIGIHVDVGIGLLQLDRLLAHGGEDLRILDPDQLLHQRVVFGRAVGIVAQGIGQEGPVAVEPEEGETLVDLAGAIDVGRREDAFLRIPGRVNPIAEHDVVVLKRPDMTGLAGDPIEMPVEQRLVLGSVVRCGAVTGHARDLDIRQIVGDQIDAHPTARDLVAFGDMTIGTLQTGRGMQVVLRTEGVAPLGPCMKQALVLLPECLCGLVVQIGIPSHVVLMAIQAIFGRRAPHGEGGAHRTILIPT